MKSKEKSDSILKKINITNSIIITTACIFIFLIFWIVNYRMMITNEQRVIDSSMRNAVSILDDKLKDMGRVSLACYSDERIQEILLHYGEYDWIQKVEAEEYLRSFYTSLITIRNDIDGVYLFTKDQLVYYSDHSISSVNRDYNIGTILEGLEHKYGNQNGKRFRLISDEPMPFIRYKTGQSSREYLYMIYSVKSFSPNTKIGYIMLSISKNKIQEIINAYMKENSRFWLTDENDKYILGTRIPDEEIMGYVAENKTFVGGMMTNKSIVRFTESEYSCLKMGTVTTLDAIRNRYWDIIKIVIVLLTLMNVFVIVLQSFFMKERLKPLQVLATFMQRFSEKKIYGRIPVQNQDEIGKLTQSFNYMMNVIETLIDKEYRHKERLQQAEIEQQKISMLYLKNQINPHFLYNTLDMIRIKAHLGGNFEVADMIMQLVQFYRLNVKADDQIVTLNHEMDLLRKYMNIMHYRYPELIFSCDVEEELLDIPIPNFLLQPLVENSLFHGLKNIRYRGAIHVNIFHEEKNPDRIDIMVSDNGAGMSQEDVNQLNENLRKITKNYKENATDRIGVENIQKRLRLYYSDGGNIRYEKNPEGGITVFVTIMRNIDNMEFSEIYK